MFVRSVKVTNNVAERGISMLKSFAGSVKDEIQFQRLLQAVERHRARLPDLTKTALNRLYKMYADSFLTRQICFIDSGRQAHGIAALHVLQIHNPNFPIKAPIIVWALKIRQ